MPFRFWRAEGVIDVKSYQIYEQDKLVTVHGDGVTDDTAAIQAALDGEFVSYANGDPVERTPDGHVILRPGVYIWGELKWRGPE